MRSPWEEEFRRNGSKCDVTLVDGDHDGVAARWDLVSMRRAASPSTSLVVDDIHLGPGYAVAHEHEAGRVQVVEQYGPFQSATALNPCMRRPKGVELTKKLYHELCHSWGFVVGRFVF